MVDKNKHQIFALQKEKEGGCEMAQQVNVLAANPNSLKSGALPPCLQWASQTEGEWGRAEEGDIVSVAPVGRGTKKVCGDSLPRRQASSSRRMPGFIQPLSSP